MLHQYGRVGDKIINLDKISPGSLGRVFAAVDDSGVRCTVCHLPLSIKADDEGRWRFFHQDVDAPAHEPDTPEHWRARQLMLRRLKSIFPSATIAEGAPVGNQAVDCLVVTPKGGRLVVEIECAQMSGEQWRKRRDDLASNGLVAFWALGSSQLPYRENKKRPTVKTRLNDLHTAMIADHQQIWMLDHEHGYLVRVEPHEDVVKLIRLGVEKIPYLVECALYRYPLSQLRMQAGTANVKTEFDPPKPDFDPIQKTLAKKLAKLQMNSAFSGSKKIY